MTATRQRTARRVLHLGAILCLIFLIFATMRGRTHLAPRRFNAIWMLTLSAYSCLYVGCALWTGGIGVGFPAVTRTVHRLDSPRLYWSHVSVAAAFAFALALLGIYYLAL